MHAVSFLEGENSNAGGQLLKLILSRKLKWDLLKVLNEGFEKGKGKKTMGEVMTFMEIQ